VSPNSEAATNKKWSTFYGIVQVTAKRYKVLLVLPHDLLAFTRGLQWQKNHLAESMGMYGDLLARIWNPGDGTIEQETKMEDKYFGEGLCWYRDEIGNDHCTAITWKEQTPLSMMKP
jgi:glutamine cyclotransferase